MKYEINNHSSFAMPHVFLHTVTKDRMCSVQRSSHDSSDRQWLLQANVEPEDNSRLLGDCCAVWSIQVLKRWCYADYDSCVGLVSVTHGANVRSCIIASDYLIMFDELCPSKMSRELNNTCIDDSLVNWLYVPTRQCCLVYGIARRPPLVILKDKLSCKWVHLNDQTRHWHFNEYKHSETKSTLLTSQS